ncbi:MAG: hypothetical protein HKN34_08990 [Gammaproteobacteria bacterium]|nr:hypothetical protein [Gammaproteobacteria bacterium]
MSQNYPQLDQATRDELVRAYIAIQQIYEEKGSIPKDSETILKRYQGLLETLGAIHLGLLVASFSIVLNFFIVNYILHLLP